MNEEESKLVQVVSVKFKNRGKTYFFSPEQLQIAAGDKVVVETSKGLELADCVHGNHYVAQSKVVSPLRSVSRIATQDDLRVSQLCAQREKEAFGICEEKIKQHGLDMKLVDVECNFEGNKIMFFFTSDGRVDFRELVKDLAGVFRTRIELRQIGVRDEAKILGGLGICGRQFCCNGFLDDFQPVSTKMAKTQSLSLNPTKISGSCGRLMCCLRYEQEAYEDLSKNVPKNGAFVETTEGYGNVTQVNLLRQKVKVRLDSADNQPIHLFDVEDVAVVPGGRPKPGEPLPHVLQVREKPKEEEFEEEDDLLSSWRMPAMFAEETAAPKQEEHKPHRGQSRRGGSRGKKPKDGAGNAKGAAEKPAKQGDKAGRDKPRKPKPPAEKPAAKPQADSGDTQEAAKKKNPRRRFYRGKGKNQGGKKPE